MSNCYETWMVGPSIDPEKVLHCYSNCCIVTQIAAIVRGAKPGWSMLKKKNFSASWTIHSTPCMPLWLVTAAHVVKDSLPWGAGLDASEDLFYPWLCNSHMLYGGHSLTLNYYYYYHFFSLSHFLLFTSQRWFI